MGGMTHVPQSQLHHHQLRLQPLLYPLHRQQLYQKFQHVKIDAESVLDFGALSGMTHASNYDLIKSYNNFLFGMNLCY